MGKNLLAIDIGTTSIRGILYSEEGRKLGMKSIQTPLVFVSSYIEQRPDVYLDSVVEICRACLTFGSIDAIALTAFRSAPALVDREGNALTNFIMWQDTRNQYICNGLMPFNEEIHSVTGAGINTVFTASKITWWKDHYPEVFKMAYKALIVPDFVMHYMTGVFATDYTYGSRTSLMNIHTLSWDDKMLEYFRLPVDILPELIPQGSVYGYVTSSFADQTGLKPGTPVISAGGDQQCGALGLGSMSESSLVINCGTGSFIVGVSNEVQDPHTRLISNVSAIPDKYIVESNILSSAAALNWLIRELTPDLWQDGSPDYDAFNQLAASSPAGANGVICVPLFQGCGTRDWNPGARASFSNISLTSTRADMVRAMLEGIASEIVQSIMAMPAHLHESDTAYLGGGMTKSDLFNQILADMSGKTLIRYEDPQATAIGAFMSASVSLGWQPSLEAAYTAVRKGTDAHIFAPDKQNHDYYKEIIRQSAQTYHSLCGGKGGDC